MQGDVVLELKGLHLAGNRKLTLWTVSQTYEISKPPAAMTLFL